jgi:glycogen debranching enzyme
MSSPAPPPPRGRPVLLTGLASAALLDGRGDLELAREMRGAPTEWGGVFGQCVRLTGPWRLELGADGRATSLPGSLLTESSTPGGWRSEHAWEGFRVTQDLAAVSELPGVVRTLRCERSQGPPRSLTIRSSFAPWLLPVLVEGIRPHRFRFERRADELRVRQRGFGLALRSNVPARAVRVDGEPRAEERWAGPAAEVVTEHELAVAPGRPADIRFLLSGGLDRDLDGARSAATSVIADPAASTRSVASADLAWEAATPVLRFPDAPELERAYGLARAGLRRLYSAPGDGLTGLVAGYPWYSALWCRDIAWMLPAVLWLGDVDWARRTIDSVLRFRSQSSVPILGGEPGELPMQISPGPIFFYGTSDTTLYYPALVAAWRRHAGLELPADWSEPLRSMLGWGERRTDPATGLLRNGGEAEAISTATQALARVRYGIDAPDTTIWDSTDRRDHAIDVQVLWWQALRAGAETLGDRGERPYRELADRLAETIRSRYRWEAEGYAFDSIRAGAPVERVRPNALRAVSAGLLPPEDGRKLVRRAARDDLTTAWGVRTLSSRDPGYAPEAYHDGQVWPIATAWAAEAALAVGDVDLGFAYLGTIARQLNGEPGCAHECYRGDRPVPFDACFLLGFSVAPFLATLFERVWGISVDAAGPTVSLAPRFPPTWRSASLERLRVGSGTVGLDWAPARTRVTWSGPGTLDLRGGPAPVRILPGGVAEVPLSADGQAS